MLNENTRKVLKSLTSVSGSAILRYPISTVSQKDKSLIAFVDLEALDEAEFGEFGVSYLSDLLSLIDFYDDANIEINAGIIDIKTETSHQRYRTTELDMMKAFDVSPKILDNLLAETPQIRFDISKDELDRYKKIASLVKSEYFVVQDGSITVCKLDATNTLLDESTTDHIMDASTEDRVAFAMTNIDKIPSGSYEVSLIKNPKSGNYISLWTSENDPFKIVVSVAKTF